MKFKVTVKVTYEIPDDKLEDYYGTTNPQEAAKIDKINFDNDLGNLLELVQSHEFTLKVEPVK